MGRIRDPEGVVLPAGDRGGGAARAVHHIAGVIAVDADAAHGLASITVLARTLDLTAIAEGVESAEQLEAVRALGCQQAQGYHLGRPMPPGDLEPLLVAQHANPRRTAFSPAPEAWCNG